MKSRRLLGIILLIIGIASVLASSYIKSQVEAGKKQVEGAQGTVDKGGSLFSLNPATKQVGKGITGSAQKKIDEGNREIAKYATIATWLQIGGIVLVILGAGVVFTGGKNRKK